MKNNGRRKLVLLSVLALFVCIYCIQLVCAGKNAIKVVSVKDEPDSFVIQTGNSEEVRLYKEDDSWFVGSRKYPAAESLAENMCAAIRSVRLLGTAARNVGGDEERYGLDSLSRTVVTAYRNGQKIQSIIVGKNTSTNRQSYIQLEKENAVYIADTALHTTFAVDVNALRSKEVYSFAASGVTGVTSIAVTHYADNEWSGYKLVKAAAEDDGAENAGALVSKDSWSFAPVDSVRDIGMGLSADADKVSSWVRSLSSLSASEWLSDDARLENADWTVTIGMTDREVTVRLHEGDEEGEDAVAWCSESPYCFTLSSYMVARFTKLPSDFLAD